MNEDFVEQLKVKHKWFRALYMVIFTAILWVVGCLTLAVMILQFLNVLFTGSVNSHLLPFSKQVIVYLTQICRFLTYETEEKPFPFGAIPQIPSNTESTSSTAKKPKGAKGK